MTGKSAHRAVYGACSESRELKVTTYAICLFAPAIAWRDRMTFSSDLQITALFVHMMKFHLQILVQVSAHEW